MLRKIIKYAIGVFVVFLVVAQLYRPEVNAPPADPAATFDAVAKPPKPISDILARSCFDCHSDQTVWPWYNRVAPVSWLLASDVKEGRQKLNFSRWSIYSPEMTHVKMVRVCREVQKGDMPPWYYLPMHPKAKLSSQDVQTLCSSGL